MYRAKLISGIPFSTADLSAQISVFRINQKTRVKKARGGEEMASSAR